MDFSKTQTWTSIDYRSRAEKATAYKSMLEATTEGGAVKFSQNLRGALNSEKCKYSKGQSWYVDLKAMTFVIDQ